MVATELVGVRCCGVLMAMAGEFGPLDISIDNDGDVTACQCSPPCEDEWVTNGWRCPSVKSYRETFPSNSEELHYSATATESVEWAVISNNLVYMFCRLSDQTWLFQRDVEPPSRIEQVLGLSFHVQGVASPKSALAAVRDNAVLISVGPVVRGGRDSANFAALYMSSSEEVLLPVVVARFFLGMTLTKAPPRQGTIHGPPGLILRREMTHGYGRWDVAAFGCMVKNLVEAPGDVVADDDLPDDFVQIDFAIDDLHLSSFEVIEDLYEFLSRFKEPVLRRASDRMRFLIGGRCLDAWYGSYPTGEGNVCLVCYSAKGAIHFANAETQAYDHCKTVKHLGCLRAWRLATARAG